MVIKRHSATYELLLIGSFRGAAESLQQILCDSDFAVTKIDSVEGVETYLSSERDLAVALIDASLPGSACYACLSRLRERAPTCQSIIITGASNILSSVEATKRGAFWVLAEPIETEQLLFVLAKACIVYELARSNRDLRSAVSAPLIAPPFVSASPVMRELLAQSERVAPLDTTILLTGESGTGKTSLARSIHQRSMRASGPFISLSCAAIPRDLLEAELFGYERGAFTGASAARPGSIELADKGTLFLDEIGELPLELQPKILTVLQDHAVKRLGSGKPRIVDIRIIAATNRDLSDMVRRGQFREDLYFRVNVVQFRLPPLRERHEDIKGLVRSVLEAISRKRAQAPFRVAPEALKMLAAYAWPGNVRELENVLERATAFCSGRTIQVGDIEPALSPGARVTHDGAHSRLVANLAGFTLAELERKALIDTLEAKNGDKAQAAKSLGVSLKTIYNKLRTYSLIE